MPDFTSFVDPASWYVGLDLPLDDEQGDMPLVADAPVPRRDDKVEHDGTTYRVRDVVWHLTPDPDGEIAVHTPWAQIVLEKEEG